jgi:hypothetical protein
MQLVIRDLSKTYPNGIAAQLERSPAGTGECTVPVIRPRHIAAHGVSPEVTPRLLRWLLAAGADELTLTVMALQGEPAAVADAFEDALAPFALPPARRRVLVDADGPGSTRVVRRWTLSEASLAALLPFVARGLFHAAPGPAGWLEDLAVYRAGELVLGVVTHEQEGTLRLTAIEHAHVASLGVQSTEGDEWVGY